MPDWKIFDPSDPAGSTLTTLDHRLGLWLEAIDAGVLPSEGTVPASTSMQLCTGWNLIGFPAAEPRHPRAALASIEGKWKRIFAYDITDTEDPWEIYDVDVPTWANDLERLHPGRGYWILVTEDTTLDFQNDGPLPEVAFTSPADLAVITEPTDILGTVRTPLLESWTLSYRFIGEAEWTQLATSQAPLENAKLATFDPTLLLNGLYEIQLEATDIKNRQVRDTIALHVEGQMKIGHFTLSFIDLQIPLSGLDIQILRTYDSRDKRLGDFGASWTLDIRQGLYQNNRPPRRRLAHSAHRRPLGPAMQRRPRNQEPSDDHPPLRPRGLPFPLGTRKPRNDYLRLHRKGKIRMGRRPPAWHEARDPWPGRSPLPQ